MHETRLDLPQILSRLPLFQELAPAQIAVLETACRERRLSKGEMLFQKGDLPKGFFVVVFGQVKLAFPSSQGNEKVVQIVGPRQSFGEAVMFMDRPYPVFAEGLVDSLLPQGMGAALAPGSVIQSLTTHRPSQAVPAPPLRVCSWDLSTEASARLEPIMGCEVWVSGWHSDRVRPRFQPGDTDVF